MAYREADKLNTYLFHEGTTISAYEFMGAHATERDGVPGYMTTWSSISTYPERMHWLAFRSASS